MPSHDETALISATPAAAALLRRLVLANGPLAIFQSGGCCDGSLPLCLAADDLAPGPGDLRLGDVVEVPFYIDAEQFRRWGEPAFVLDLAAGAPEGFSLGAADAHFVTRSGPCGTCLVKQARDPEPPEAPRGRGVAERRPAASPRSSDRGGADRGIGAARAAGRRFRDSARGRRPPAVR